MKKHFAGLILILMMSACGFHLRGMIDIPQWLENVALVSPEGNKELRDILERQLEGYKIHVSDDPSKAKYWLVIVHTDFKQQITSVGASTNPRQYQLIYTVSYMLQTPKGVEVRPQNTVTVFRLLTVNNDRILGSNEEESQFLDEMQREAALQIINRLSH